MEWFGEPKNAEGSYACLIQGSRLRERENAMFCFRSPEPFEQAVLLFPSPVFSLYSLVCVFAFHAFHCIHSHVHTYMCIQRAVIRPSSSLCADVCQA